MAKDPAFLFYSNDFLTGTYLMTNEQVGQYIRLMCLQHQKGHLTEKDMLKICNTQDEEVISKFKKDEEGLYYNERLEEEITRRKAYSKSRSENRKKKEKDNICETYVPHMENENEIENINLNNNNKIKEFKKPKSNNAYVNESQSEFNNLDRFYNQM